MVFSNSHATTMANEKKRSGPEGSRSAGLIERHEENKRCALALFSGLASN